MVRVASGSELNKQKVRLFIEAVWNDGRLELIDELVGDDYVGHEPSLEERVLGPQGVRRLVESRRTAHPDLHVKIVDQVAEDDRVATRWQATSPASAAGANGGDAGRTRCCAGISIVRLLAGKQVDSHTECTDQARDADVARR